VLVAAARVVAASRAAPRRRHVLGCRRVTAPHPAAANRSESTARPARLLVVTHRLPGSGGAQEALARALAAAGNDVTLLCSGWPEYSAAEAHVAPLAADGIRFEWLKGPWDVFVRSPHQQVRRAYDLHRWLTIAHAERPFDVAHVPVQLGHGALAQTAKRLGAAYRDLRFVVEAGEPDERATDGIEPSEEAAAAPDAPAALDALVTAQLERLSVERADAIVAADAAALERLAAAGWSLPERSSTTAQPADGADADRWYRELAAADAGAPVATAPPVAAVACVTAPDAAAAARVVDALRSGTDVPRRIVAIVEQAPAQPLEQVELVVADGAEGIAAARRRLAEQLGDDVLLVLRGNDVPDPTLVTLVLAAMRTGGSDLLTLVTRDADGERETDAPWWLRPQRPPRDLRAFVPAPGPALAALLYPALAVGPYAITGDALRRLALDGPPAGADPDRDLLARAAVAGMAVDLLPDPVATTIEDDAWSSFRARTWGRAALPAAPAPGPLGGTLSELPALLDATTRAVGAAAAEAATAHERERETRAALERRIVELDDAIAGYEQRLAEHRELIDVYERQKGELNEALARARQDADSLSSAVARNLPEPLRHLPERGARLLRRRPRGPQRR
jgi:hypothetical protein